MDVDEVVEEVEEVVLVASVDPDVVDELEVVVLEATVVEAAALAIADVVSEDEVVVVSDVSDVVLAAAVSEEDLEVVSSVVVASLVELFVVSVAVESLLLFNSFPRYSSSSASARGLHVSAHRCDSSTDSFDVQPDDNRHCWIRSKISLFVSSSKHSKIAPMSQSIVDSRIAL